MENNNKLNIISPEERLPKEIFEKAIICSNEFGWKKLDFIHAVESAREKQMAIIGGQVQYRFPDATCQLYWLSYDPAKRQLDEDWLTYCNRTTSECIDKFIILIESTDIQKEASDNFGYLAKKVEQGVNIADFQVFILYFDDKETDSFLN